VSDSSLCNLQAISIIYSGRDFASIFSLLWMSVLVFLLYKILRSCAKSRPLGPTPREDRGSTPNYGGPGGWFPGTGEPHAPPPYTKHASNSNDAWQPGFWTGTAVGATGTYLMNRNNDRRRPSPPAPPRAAWDWERTATSSHSSSRVDNSDRGEGSSNLGAMRSSVGYGGSRVR
jgi:hypothetical protein